MKACHLSCPFVENRHIFQFPLWIWSHGEYYSSTGMKQPAAALLAIKDADWMWLSGT